MTAPELPSGVPIDAPAASDVGPPRAIWSIKAPEGPWCPDQWIEHLERVAPGLRRPEGYHEPVEATGARALSTGWSLVLASRRGRLHAHRGEHREDAGAVLTFATGWCAAIGDGAGSATWSRLGSAIATHVVTHALRDALKHGAVPRSALTAAIQQAAGLANDAMRHFASLADVALRDLRTTLLVVAVHDGALASLQVGDGAIAFVNSENGVQLPHAGDSGEFSGEVTHFLPDDGAVERLLASLVVRESASGVAIVAASDGVDDPWYPFARHAPALFAQLRDGVDDENAAAAGVTQAWRGAVLGAADPVHATIEWLAFEKRGENDDRTVFVAWDSSTSA